MKQLLSIVTVSLILCASCAKERPSGPDLHAEMREAAKTYYTQLMDSDYIAFAEGIAVSSLGMEGGAGDSLPADYRRQLACDAAQYMSFEARNRGGIAAFNIDGDSLYADSISGHVNICLTFGDNSQENIALHLIKTKDGWKME